MYIIWGIISCSIVIITVIAFIEAWCDGEKGFAVVSFVLAVIFAVSTIFCFTKAQEEKVREEIVKENLNQGGRKMEQFSLKKYLKNPDRKVVTRDGRDVRIICTDRKGKCPIVGLVKADDDSEILISIRENGCEMNENSISCFDLFFVPIKHVGWTNVYKNSFGQLLLGSNFPYKTEEEARKDSVTNSKYEIYCGTVRLEWEE